MKFMILSRIRVSNWVSFPKWVIDLWKTWKNWRLGGDDDEDEARDALFLRASSWE